MSAGQDCIEAINEMLKNAYLAGDLYHGVFAGEMSEEECADAYVRHINDGLGIDNATKSKAIIVAGIEALRRDNASFTAANTDLVSEVETLRQQLADERDKALEDAASYVERIAHQGLHASMWRDKFKQASDAIRAMKDKP